MRIGRGGASWNAPDASASPPTGRGKKLVALAATMGMGASLFGLTTLATSAGAAPNYVGFKNGCVAASAIGDQFEYPATGFTVDAPATAHPGEQIVIRYTVDAGSYPDKGGGGLATTTNISRQKIDMQLPSGTAYVSGSIVPNSAINISGTTPNVLLVGATGGTNNTGVPDPNGTVIRMSGNNQIITSAATSGQSDSGILIPKTKKNLDGSTNSNGDTWFKLPAFEATLTVTATPGSTIEPTVRQDNGGTTWGSLNAYATSLAKASAFLLGTQYAPTRCVPTDTQEGPLNDGAGPLASIAVVAWNTSTGLVATPSTADQGNNVELKATVTSSGSGLATMNGNVVFKDGGSPIGTVAINGSGVATFNTSSLSVGTHSITAEYAGNTDFNGSVSSAQTVTINAPAPLTDPTDTSVSGPATALVDAEVELVATVTSSGGTPSGDVEFFDGIDSLGTETLDGSGQATLTTQFYTAGTHSITASYLGDSNFDPSSSPTPWDVTVRNASQTHVTASPTSVTGSGSVTVTATVADSGGPIPGASGSVEFFVDNVSAGTSAVSSSVATKSVSLSGEGGHVIKAVYSGGGDLAGSTGYALGNVFAVGATESPVTGALSVQGSFLENPISADLPAGNLVSVLGDDGNGGTNLNGVLDFAELQLPIPDFGVVVGITIGQGGLFEGNVDSNGDATANFDMYFKVNSADLGGGPAPMAGDCLIGPMPVSFTGVQTGNIVSLSASGFMVSPMDDAGCGGLGGIINAFLAGDNTSMDLNIELPAEDTVVSGTVTDGTNPLGGIRVHLMDAATLSPVDMTLTAVDGSYAFDDVAPGNYKVRFTDPRAEFLTQWNGGALSGTLASTISVTEATTTTVDATMDTGDNRFTGKVTGVNNAPLAGVKVAVQDLDGRVVASTRTDSAGEYTIKGIPEGDYKVRFAAPDGTLYSTVWNGRASSFASADQIALSGRVYVAVKLPYRAFTGTVTDSSSNPIEGAKVVVLEITGYDQSGAPTVNRVARTFTAADGSYTMPGVPAGDYIVQSGADGYSNVFYDGKLARRNAAIVTVDDSGSLVGLDEINFVLPGGNQGI